MSVPNSISVDQHVARTASLALCLQPSMYFKQPQDGTDVVVMGYQCSLQHHREIISTTDQMISTQQSEQRKQRASLILDFNDRP